jgi:acetyl esterase/lipase
MFWHGGSWVHGNKSYFGMVSRLCERLARNGIAAVSANYRLKSPHPAHMEDVARAFAWVHKNIAGHGGRPDQVFVGGHSAGGHLASLLAVDPTYLQAVKLTPDVIKGVLPMSGVFRLPDQVRTFEHAFGTDPEKRKDAMPFFQVGRLDPAAKPKLPPFLILYASYDFELCGKEHADAFCRALCDKKCNAEVCLIKNRNHSTILLNSGRDDDPAGTAMIDFIRAKTKP